MPVSLQLKAKGDIGNAPSRGPILSLTAPTHGPDCPMIGATLESRRCRLPILEPNLATFFSVIKCRLNCCSLQLLADLVHKGPSAVCNVQRSR